MKVTKFAVAVLALSTFAAPAVRAQSLPASARVPADVRPQPFPYPCPTFPRPTPGPTYRPTTDCGRSGPIIQPIHPNQTPPVSAEPYNTVVNRRITLISDAFGRGGAASLDALFNGSASRSGPVDATPVLAAESMEAVPREATLSARRVMLMGREVPAPAPVERFQGARIVQVQFKQVVQAAAAGAVATKVVEAAAQKANQAAQAANQAVNNYVNRDQTKESIEKYGGCRMKDTCPK